MVDDAIKTVLMRNTFYRDNYRRALLALLMALVIIVGLAGILFYMISHPTQPVYFATSDDGRIVKLEPLNRPYVSQNDLLQWVTTAAVSSYTYDFVNYRKNLTDASQYYTPQAWRDFMAALNQTRVLETVRAKSLIVTAVATAAPSIVQKGVINGRFTWKISLPILVTYVSGSDKSQQAYIITMNVIRVSSLDMPKGIAISSFVATPGATGGP